MSHFTVLVIGENVEDLLQPYHEYECTGVEDQYVVDVDMTDEVLEKWKSTPAKERKEYGYTIIDDLARDYYGAYPNDQGRFVRKTNPNAKWDWWQIGGRWQGMFKLKPGAEGASGQASLLMDDHQYQEDRVDQARKGDIDFEFMKNEAREEAAQTWDEVFEKVWQFEKPLPWAQIRDELFSEDIDQARDFYNNQRAVVAFREMKGFWNTHVEDFFIWDEGGRQKYIDSQECNGYMTFAVCSEDGWFEKGSMGWWGVVTDEKLKYDWAAQFNDLLEGLPDDTLLTIVDAHI